MTEAENPAGEMFGHERLDTMFRASPRVPAEAARFVTDGLRQFVGTAPQTDDITWLCFGRNGD